MKNKFIPAVTAAVLVFACTTSVFADKIGVNMHMGHAYRTEPNINAVNELDADIVRDGYGWGNVEKEKGKLELPFRSNGDFVEEAYKNGKKVIFVLGYENSLYTSETGKIMPHNGETEEEKAYFEAWLNYVRFIAEQYKGKVYAYEVWNEPDLLEFNPKYCDNPSVYSELLKATYEVIDSVDKNALVIGGAVAVHYDFYLDGLLKAGGGDYMDAVSVHTYHQADDGPEENFVKTMEGVEAILDKYNFTKPLWLTENGWYTGELDTAVTEEKQAEYIIRAAALWEDFLNRNNRDGEYVWYDLRDDESNKIPHEKKWGLTDIDYNPKKAFYAAKAYNNATGDKKIEKLTSDNSTYLAKYSDGEHKHTYITWNLNGNGKVTTDEVYDVIKYYDYLGNLISSGSGKVEISVGTAPVIVECTNGIVKLNELEINETKSAVKVSGNVKNTSQVSVQVWFNNKYESTKTVSVDKNGMFELYIPAGKIGTYTVKVGSGEEDSTWDSDTITVSEEKTAEEIISGVTAVFDKENMTVTVGGSVLGAENDTSAAIAVVPKNMKLSESNIGECIYLDEIEITNGTFNKVIHLPADAAGEYDVLIKSKKSENVSHGTLFDIKTKYAKVVSFRADKDENNMITVSANILNKNSEDKSAVVMIACYDENKTLISVTPHIIKISANQREAELYTVNEKMNSSATTFRAFIWDSISDMYPLY